MMPDLKTIGLPATTRMQILTSTTFVFNAEVRKLVGDIKRPELHSSFTTIVKSSTSVLMRNSVVGFSFSKYAALPAQIHCETAWRLVQ